MPRYETTQQGKIVTSYGGPGSLMESYKYGCLLIKPFDQWKFYRNRCDRNQNLFADFQNALIKLDVKLLAVIHKLGYPNVKNFFTPPANELKDFGRGVEERNNLFGVERFPKWYFCPNCHHLRHIKEWERIWVQEQRANKLKNWADFDEPCCIDCAIKANNRNSKKIYYRLEQMRYVAASKETSDLIDIPWDILIEQPLGVEKVDIESQYEYITNRDENDNYMPSELKYRTSAHSDNLQYMTIRKGDRRRSLGDLTKIKFIKDGHEYQMIIRSASSVHTPKVYSSLYVPYDNNDNNDKELDIETADRLEFDHITNNEKINDDDLICHRVDGIGKIGIKNLYNVRKLKDTTVLYGYSRLNSEEIFHIADEPSKVEYMPCVEKYGEGIVIEMDSTTLKNCDQADVKIIVHTLAHAVIKEMEFECGYDSTSFKEKIYIDTEKNKYGCIVYCVAGADGSMGGIASLFDSNKVFELIENAVDRLEMCPHDPICSIEKGHCYACLDLSEVTCHEGDSLDRRKMLEYVKKLNN